MTYTIFTIFGFFTAFFLLASLCSKTGRTTNKLISHALACAIAWFYGFRSAEVGIDTKEYISRFHGETLTADFIFSWISIFLKRIGVDQSQYLFLIALSTSLFLLHAIKNFSGSYRTASLFLGLAAFLPYGIMQYINISRQGLAVAIILFAISLTVKGTVVLGSMAGVATLFIHRTTALVYIVSQLTKNILKNKYGLLILFLLLVSALSISAYAYELISLFDSTLAEKYLNYSVRDTSESPWFIYLKLAWAFFHWWLLAKINSFKPLPNALYHYYAIVILTSIALLPNPLVATRVLSAIDFILPVLYSIPPSKEGKSFRIFGLLTLILYAIVSPFSFRMYDLNFGW